MKFLDCWFNLSCVRRRSREGAWIEIANILSTALQANGRSREGAWIEIRVCGKMLAVPPVAPARERGLKLLLLLACLIAFLVAPARERGLKSTSIVPAVNTTAVAPARERGLKCKVRCSTYAQIWSLPRGSVD